MSKLFLSKKLKSFYLCVIFLLIYKGVINSQSIGEIANKFIDFSLNNTTISVKAKLFIPSALDSTRKYPLVLTLHGTGEKGSDNISQVMSILPTSFARTESQTLNPCFILSPQCPLNINMWIDQYLYNAIEIILDSLINNYPIDSNRIYITGLSLGGMGVWDYIIKNPSRYAAAIPVSGSSGILEVNKNYIKKIDLIPIWNFHGNQDNIVKVWSSRTIFNEFIDILEYPLLTHNFYRINYSLSDSAINYWIESYADLIYSEIPNIGHNAWDYAYNMPLVKKWLFMQYKREADNFILDRKNTINKITDNYTFNFETSNKVDSISIWFCLKNSWEWKKIDKIIGSKDYYIFNSTKINDCSYGLLRFLSHDSLGNIIDRDYSDLFCINNIGNSPPCIEFIDDRFFQYDYNNKRIYNCQIKIDDPEEDSLTLNFLISIDNGKSFSQYAYFKTDTGKVSQIIQMSDFNFVDSMVIKVEVSDNEFTNSIQTLPFKNYIIETEIYNDISNSFISIYPNPVSDKFSFNQGSLLFPLTIEIYDLNGKMVFKAKMPENREINIRQIVKGVYIIKIKSDEDYYYSKLIKV